MQNKLRIFLRFFVIFFDIVKSSLIMAYYIVTNAKINSYISVDKIQASELEIALIANFITITPGTIAIAVNKDNIVIHNFN